MKIALVSTRTKDSDIAFNTSQIINAIEKHKSVDLICFGEAFLQGFNPLCWDYETDKSIAVTSDCDEIKEIKRKAKENCVAVAFGYFELAQNEIYSSYIFIGKDGELVTNFRRVSNGWKEYTLTDDHYKEGNGFYALNFSAKDLP